MGKKKYIFILIALFSSKLFSQNVSAYIDKNGGFYIFDNGISTRYELQSPISYKIGGNCIAYLDNSSTFKIYYNGKVIKPFGDNIIDNYTVTHNLVLFTARNTILVFDQGKTDTLTTYRGYNPGVNDSLVVFQEGNTKSLLVYYKGKIDTLAIPASDLPGYYSGFGHYGYSYHYETGKNIVAFIDNLELKVFYQNNLYTLLKLPKSKKNNPYSYPIADNPNLKLGNNIVSFINPATKELSVFYKGLSYKLSKRVYEVQTGDDMVAYDDSLGLHVFYSGKNYDLAPVSTWVGYKPTTFSVKDSTLTYYTKGRLKVFINGDITDINDRWPGDYKVDTKLVVWLDLQNNLNALYDGKTYTLSTFVRPFGYAVSGNTVWFKVSPNEDHVFFKGKIY